MKLAIITDDGTVLTVVKNIEEYNLDKAIAASDVLEAIKSEMLQQIAFNDSLKRQITKERRK